MLGKIQIDHSAVGVMPYLRLPVDMSFSLGPFVVTSSRSLPSMVLGNETHDRLKEILGRYRNQFGETYSPITLLLLKGKAGTEYSHKLWPRAFSYIDLLSMSAFASRSFDRSILSEHFLLHPYPLDMNKDWVSVAAGSISPTLWGGLKTHEIRFHQPWSITTHWELRFDEELMNALTEYQSPWNSARARRLRRAARLLRVAWANPDYHDRYSRLILLHVGIETLLDIPSRSTAQKFASCVDAELGGSLQRINWRSLGNDRIYLTAVGAWAYDFYKARNAIAHGDLVRPSMLKFRTGVSHQEIATTVLVELARSMCLGPIPGISLEDLDRRALWPTWNFLPLAYPTDE